MTYLLTITYKSRNGEKKSLTYNCVSKAQMLKELDSALRHAMQHDGGKKAVPALAAYLALHGTPTPARVQIAVGPWTFDIEGPTA